MRLKSFYGPNVTEAMRLVRETLGDNAIIVATRDDEMGGVRVTAAIDDIAPQPEKISQVTCDDADCEAIETIASALVKHAVSGVLAERLMATATQFANEDPLLSFGAALDMHLKFEPLTLDKPTKPIILIGPPGAGKTLCAAKLATKATMEKRSVAVLCTDIERAGGMAQLEAFTRLLKIDMIEIEDPHALRDAVFMQKPGTLILIDSAGCNPFVEQDRQTLAAIIKASGAQPILVMPADMDASEAIDKIKEFQSLGVSALLPTRLDMTSRLGGLLRLAFETRLPFCNFSASGNVTQAPQPLNPVSLARLILPPNVLIKHKATGTHASGA